MLAPYLQAILGMIGLQFRILGHQLFGKRQVLGYKVVNSLDIINILANLHLLTIQASKRETTHSGGVQLFLDLGIDIPYTVGNLKRMLDIQIDFHDAVAIRTVIQPTWGLGSEVESGSEQAVILAVSANLIDAELGKVGMGSVLDYKRTALFIYNL